MICLHQKTILVFVSCKQQCGIFNILWFGIGFTVSLNNCVLTHYTVEKMNYFYFYLLVYNLKKYHRIKINWKININTYLNSVLGNWLLGNKGWGSMDTEIFCSACITGDTCATVPCETELLANRVGWDCIGSELTGSETLFFVSPTVAGEFQRVKSGNIDGGWTFDNKLPVGGFMTFVACLENVEPLTDPAYWVIFILAYLLR